MGALHLSMHTTWELANEAAYNERQTGPVYLVAWSASRPPSNHT